jgi:formylglycine-generating enzyme required for sulfatase activity
MAKIFISYRREDSQHQADRLHAILKKHVPDAKRNIFIDVDNIPVGVDFARYLDEQVSQCDVLLALIGPDWLSAADPATGRRRLDNPKDFVRIEIASALKRDIPVAPVLLDGAPFPREEELPDDLKPLVHRNGVELRRMSFDADADRLIRGLNLKGGAHPAARTTGEKRGTGRKATSSGGWIAPVAALTLLAVAGGGAWAWFANPGGWRTALAGAAETGGEPWDPNGVMPANVTAHGGAGPGPNAFVQAPGPCGDIRARVQFDFDKSSLGAPAVAALEGALRASFDCVIDTVTIEAHEDLGGSAAYARGVSERRADAVAAVFRAAGVEGGAIRQFGFGHSRPLEPDVVSPLNRRADVVLDLIAPATAAVEPTADAPSAAPAAASAATTVESFRDCDFCPEMVAIPAGSFLMGSPSSENGREDREGPQRTVRIDYSFLVGKYEVTWAEYKACVSDGGCRAAKDDGFGGGRHPVTNVSWDDAKAYIAWLSRKTRKTYRLLSEAEWEYAARGGTAGPFLWGQDENAGCDHANGADMSVRDQSYWRSTCDDGVGKQTAEAGRYRANAFGLHDIIGNVSEWVEDCLESSYSAGQPSDGRAFTGGSCSLRVYRGGSWISTPRDLRSAVRSTASRSDTRGFRVARTN